MTSSEAVAGVQQAEQLRIKLMLASDLQAMGDLLDPALHYTHSTGRVDSRDSLLELLGSGKTTYLDASHELDEFMQIGDLVIVEGRLQLRLISAGVEKILATSTHSVWVQGGDAWRLRAFLSTSTPG